MSNLRSLTLSLAAPRAGSDQSWLPGLLHVAAAASVWPVLGGAAFVAGLLMASLASFVVFLPMVTLALNGGEPLAAGAEAPALTPRAQAVLLGLWTLAAWGFAALSTLTV
jgi:hypothetical protein